MTYVQNSKIPSSRFAGALQRLTAHTVDIMVAVNDADLEWISANRDFGEDERYRAKDAVDESLLGTAETTSERQLIEDCFASGGLSDQYRRYVDRLDIVLGQVHDLLVDAASNSKAWSLAQHADFWSRFAPVANRDNAHAMYLSSGNWDFSVFNPLLDLFEDWTSDRPSLLQHLLTAGVQDIRTSVYSEFSTVYQGMSRCEFVAAIRTKADWQRSDGLLTLMSYAPASGVRGSLGEIPSTALLKQNFDAAVDEIVGCQVGCHVDELVRLYQRMYELRRLYDIYEYFGAYSFLRNLAIRRTAQAFGSEFDSEASKFSYLATTYQFECAEKTIREVQS